MRQCPVLGCKRDRHGIMCPTHWHMLPRWSKQQLRNGLTPAALRVAIAEAIQAEQALRDSVYGAVEAPDFTPSQGGSNASTCSEGHGSQTQ